MLMNLDLKYLNQCEVGDLYQHCTDEDRSFTPTRALFAMYLRPLFFGRYEYQGQPFDAIARDHSKHSVPYYFLYLGEQQVAEISDTRHPNGQAQLVPYPSLDQLCSNIATLDRALFRDAMCDYDLPLRQMVLPLLDPNAIWLGQWSVEKGKDYGAERVNQYKLWCKLFGEPYQIDDDTYRAFFHFGLQREIGLRVSAWMDKLHAQNKHIQSLTNVK